MLPPQDRTLRRSDFPADFVWGTATASYQIEGAPNADGKGASIWDAFARTHGAISDGTTGDIADDHYYRFREDIALLADLGLEAYRFSISWPRVQPDGTSHSTNAKGLAFYRSLVEELLRRGITPWATLYHWDLPLALEDRGGWMARDTAERFGEYAAVVAGELGDVVGHWITLNEPWCSSFLGYGAGVHAPGKRLGAHAARAAHHLLLGHGRAVAAVRAARPAASVGITLNLSPTEPASGAPGDVEAARQVDGMLNRLFLDPVLTGAYPDDTLRDLRQVEWFAAQPAADLASIAAPIDFIGINYYFKNLVAAGDADTEPVPELPTTTPIRMLDAGLPRTQMHWPITPAGITDAMRMIHDRKSDLPILITENGAAFDDLVVDGEVRDEQRRAYIYEHLDACRKAIADGLPLRGYFVWTLLDNFEWSWGQSRRFGVVRVDYATQRRTVKLSGRWLAGFLRER